MNRKYLLEVAAVVGTLSAPGAASGETFLAIGLPEGNPLNGWVYGYAPTEAQAMNLCHGVETANNENNGILNVPRNVSRAQRACEVVGDLINECFSIASNGTATTAASAIGWVISKDEDATRSGAMARCNAMRSSGATPCIIRYAYCDTDN